MRIGDLLRNKPSHDVITISPEASVRELIALLAEHNVGALIGADGTSVDGIVSERDVVRRLVEHDEVLLGPVAAIMTESVETVDEQGLVDDLMKTMTEPHPARAGGHQRPAERIISIGDIVKHRIDQLEFERDQLDHYVHGVEPRAVGQRTTSLVSPRHSPVARKPSSWAVYGARSMPWALTQALVAVRRA